MRILNSKISPNFSKSEISVEFIVLHYTACNLQKTLEIFLNPSTQVTSHFVIDTNGDCYDLGHCLEGPVFKGAHAGKSLIELDGKNWTALNENSIGIEIINLNGNLFTYTDAQYESLSTLILLLQTRFPSLKNSNRIVGHEHIAGFRGKADPGLCFDWLRLFNDLSLKPAPFHLHYVCEKDDLDFLQNEINKQSDTPQLDFWPNLSTALETRIKERKQTI